MVGVDATSDLLAATGGVAMTYPTAKLFIFGGNATFTVMSEKTGVRYTYRVVLSDENEDQTVYFVSVLVGPDNFSDYAYIGIVPKDKRDTFIITKKSRMTGESKPVVAFRFLLQCLKRKTIPEGLKVWHNGRCGRCGHLLTTPESIRNGFGPTCVHLAS